MLNGKRFTAEVISAGRVTIPLPLRKLLKIVEGDILEIEILSQSPRATPRPQEGGPLQSEAQVNPQGG